MECFVRQNGLEIRETTEMTDSEPTPKTQVTDATEGSEQNKSDVKLQEKYVKYVGLSDIRRIDKSDQKNHLGIEEPESDVVWDKHNGWTIAVNELPENVVKYCQYDNELVTVTE